MLPASESQLSELDPLTSEEQQWLSQQEAIIERGLQTFWEVGQALAVVRNQRLYRGTHTDFDTYLHERWKISRSYAHRLITATEVRQQLLPTGNDLPENESQVRPLLRLKAEEARRHVWEVAHQSAAAEGRPLTARHVQEALDAHYPPSVAPKKLNPVSMAEQEVLRWAREYANASKDARTRAQQQLLQAARRLGKRGRQRGRQSPASEERLEEREG